MTEEGKYLMRQCLSSANEKQGNKEGNLDRHICGRDGHYKYSVRRRAGPD